MAYGSRDSPTGVCATFNCERYPLWAVRGDFSSLESADHDSEEVLTNSYLCCFLIWIYWPMFPYFGWQGIELPVQQLLHTRISTEGVDLFAV